MLEPRHKYLVFAIALSLTLASTLIALFMLILTLYILTIILCLYNYITLYLLLISLSSYKQEDNCVPQLLSKELRGKVLEPLIENPTSLLVLS